MKEFETDAFKLILHDDLIKEVIVKKNVELQARDVWESRDLSANYKPGAKFFVIIEGEEGARVSPDARRAAASEEYNKETAALALCGNSTTAAIGGNLFLKVNRPRVPTKFFSDRNKAIEWLKIMPDKAV
jgi:hypothetical protein